MNIKDLFVKSRKVTELKLITEQTSGTYMFDGTIYRSDIVRACLKPYVKAIGKLVGKHIRRTGNKIDVNPEVYLRFLLEEPNEYMTGQMFQEKMASQLALNGNAFALIIRDQNGTPTGMYPLPANRVETDWRDSGLWLRFYFKSKIMSFPYTDIIHLRDDYSSKDIFGDSPVEAITDMLEVVGTIDFGIKRAIKNSGAIRWLLKIVNSLRDDQIKEYADNFAKNYLSLESESLGVAAIDSKADAIQVTNTEYVPNNAIALDKKNRIQAFFGTNEKIVHSEQNENEWIAYYESRIEPYAIQMGGEYTRKIFNRKQRGYGNSIMFESSNLTYASMQTKLNLVQYVDRGIMTPNEVRSYLNLAPLDGGDTPLLRKDTGKLTEEGGNDDD